MLNDKSKISLLKKILEKNLLNFLDFFARKILNMNNFYIIRSHKR